MSLSDKIHNGCGMIMEDDVKDFIKQLKEEICTEDYEDDYDLCLIIDKLVGDKLI